jgi:TonB family protein
MQKTGWVVLALAAMVPAISAALAGTPSPGEEASHGVPIEVIQSPKITRFPTGNLYPSNEVRDGREGWVVMTIMVDSNARPVDAMINASSGNPAFERAALNAVNKMTFEPARRNGTPVDGTFKFKLKFAIDNPAKGARSAFAASYRRLLKAIEARDKPGADEQLERLKPVNLYEDAFANFAKYYYDVAWGTREEQREDLAAAIAGEREPVYLSKENFVTALYMKLKLEIESSEYGSALDTWEVLEPLADTDMRTKVQKVIDEIHALQAGDKRTRITAVMGDSGRWSTTLLRNRFHVLVKDGTIRDVQLTCARKVVSFAFDPAMEYTLPADAERCEATLQGRPGTSFEFNQ